MEIPGLFRYFSTPISHQLYLLYKAKPAHNVRCPQTEALPVSLQVGSVPAQDPSWTEVSSNQTGSSAPQSVWGETGTAALPQTSPPLPPPRQPGCSPITPSYA